MSVEHLVRSEHPSTYFVEDRSNTEEKQRLQIQDELLTIALGGVLPEQPDPARFKQILDVGCGTGGWLLETARAYPRINTFQIRATISAKGLWR